MATTTNFGWETPDDTDLVKDGAAAMRTLGNSIDTSFVDLKGGTTGQVLAKASGTDLDFTWVAQDDSNAIQNAIVDAKGDLIAATAADTPARLPVGTNGQILTADSTTATGLAWTTASSSSPLTTKGDLYTYNTANARLGVGTNGFILQADSAESTGIKWTAAGRYLLASGTLSGSTLDLTSISGNYTHLEVIFRNYYGSTDQAINATINNDSASNKYATNNGPTGNISYNASSFTPVFTYDSTDQNNLSVIRFYDYAGSADKLVQNFMNTTDATNSQRYAGLYHTTIYKSTSAISRLTFTTSSGTWSGGTYQVWGVK